MKNFLEAFISGFVGGLFIYLILLFVRKNIKVYKDSLTEIEKEKLFLKEEKKDYLYNKEKIIEDRTIKEMEELGINPDSNYQKYYSIKEEQEKKIENRIKEIDKKLSDSSRINSQ